MSETPCLTLVSFMRSFIPEKFMRARTGDLAIARFDPCDEDIQAGRKWCEKVGIVIRTGVQGPKKTRYHEFIWWDDGAGHYDIIPTELPPHRLVRARPKNDAWEGTLSSLTLDTVEPV